jgi:hypothetical protein
MYSFFTHTVCLVIGAIVGIVVMCLLRAASSFDEINGTPVTEDEHVEKFLEKREPMRIIKMDGKLSHLNREFRETEIAE